MTFRSIIDSAVAEAMADRPKYFTEAGHSHARKLIVGKIMAMLRDGGDKAAADSGAENVAAPQTPVGPALFDPDSREARAARKLREAARAAQPVRCADGRISVMPELLRPDAMAFADCPPRDKWLFLTDHQQLGAWREFFAQVLKESPRGALTFDRDGRTGALLPWPWPPTVEGKVFSAGESEAVA